MSTDYSIGYVFIPPAVADTPEGDAIINRMADPSVGQYINLLLRGVVEPLMLFIINELPSHGYSIAKEIERRSSGYLKLTASTVYTALRRLEAEGLVLSTWQSVANSQRRRSYQLTDKGKRLLKTQLSEWERFSVATERVVTSD
jgi:PadR family transcriptional regulator PadR